MPQSCRFILVQVFVVLAFAALATAAPAGEAKSPQPPFLDALEAVIQPTGAFGWIDAFDNSTAAVFLNEGAEKVTYETFKPLCASQEPGAKLQYAKLHNNIKTDIGFRIKTHYMMVCGKSFVVIGATVDADGESGNVPLLVVRYGLADQAKKTPVKPAGKEK